MKGKSIMMVLIIIMGIMAIIIGVVYKNNGIEKYFYATVMEVQDGYILVSPLPSEDIYKSTDKILISTDDSYSEEDNVIVYYKGDISETYPSTVDVIEIEIIGGVVEDDNEDSISSSDNDINNNKDEIDNKNNDSVGNKNEVSNNLYTEEDVINYFDSELVEVSSYQDSGIYKEKAKNMFVSVVDFLFYDKEIKGYTFGELSDMAKLKVLDIAFKIDSEIEELFPGYKDSLSDKYNKAKDMIVTKYLEITVNVCSDNGDYCNKAKDVWATIKEKAGLSWNVIKEYANKGISNLKEWYEVYSGK